MKLFQIQNSQTSLLVSSSPSNVQTSLCASTKSVCPLSGSFIEYLRFNLYSICSFQGTFRKLSFPSGDGEIRTHDPLLARQVLSQLSYTPIWIWHPPIFPCRLQHSIFGRLSLNRRVRDGNGCYPQAHRHRNVSRSQVLRSILKRHVKNSFF